MKNLKYFIRWRYAGDSFRLRPPKHGILVVLENPHAFLYGMLSPGMRGSPACASTTSVKCTHGLFEMTPFPLQAPMKRLRIGNRPRERNFEGALGPVLGIQTQIAEECTFDR